MRWMDAKWGLLPVVAATLVACGGGGDTAKDNVDTGTSVTLSGSAATGLALGNATVAVKCATGSGDATTNAAGAYSVTLSNAALPCVLKVTSADNTVTYHSVAAGSGGGAAVANITPLTELVVARATGMTPAQFFNNFSSAQSQVITDSALDSAVAEVATALNSALSIGALNPLTDALVPATPSNLSGGNAYDQLLDQLKAAITIANTSLEALTTLVAKDGGSITLGDALQSDLAAAATDGFFELYSDGGRWNLVDHHATGSAVNGVYTIQGLSYGNVNSAWSINSTDIDNSLFLGPNGWVDEPRQESGTLKQMGPIDFNYRNTSGRSWNFAIQPADISSINLATVNASLPSTVVNLPAGAKVFNFSITRTSDEYRLLFFGTFYSGNSLSDFRSFYREGSEFLTHMSGSPFAPRYLYWQFGAGVTHGVLHLFERQQGECELGCGWAPWSENGTWDVLTVNGVELVVLTFPTEMESWVGLASGQKYFYSLSPSGNVLEGVYTPASMPGDSFSAYNRTAMRAILSAAGMPALPSN